MGTFNSTPLGIVICPGAEAFAAQLIHHIEELWRQRFMQKCKSIANTYGFEEEFALKFSILVMIYSQHDLFREDLLRHFELHDLR